ncbi:MAG: exosome complex RNA-binding protein Csl4 [Candidatus Altarchaeaceae archaeon]
MRKEKDKEMIPVFIGDYVGTIEEYIPGDGTYVENGKIYAANIGYLNFSRERVVTVSSKISKIKEGNVVFGEVISMTKDSVFVNIERVMGIRSPLNLIGRIFIADISGEYIKDIGDYFRIGDIVKAKIYRVEGNLIDLSTKGEFGVVKAFCNDCRNPLRYNKEKNILVCENCKKEYKRKISSDYGNCRDILL